MLRVLFMKDTRRTQAACILLVLQVEIKDSEPLLILSELVFQVVLLHYEIRSQILRVEVNHSYPIETLEIVTDVSHFKSC